MVWILLIVTLMFVAAAGMVLARRQTGELGTVSQQWLSERRLGQAYDQDR